MTSEFILMVCSKLAAIPSEEDSVKIWVGKAADTARAGYPLLLDALYIVKRSIEPTWEPDTEQRLHQARIHVEQMLAELSALPTPAFAVDDSY
jgi:hypothetical protein